MITTHHARQDVLQQVLALRTHGGLIALLIAVVAAHLSLLRVPYYWDEVYYSSVARDLFLTGKLIPTSVPVESHPPFIYFWLCCWWKIFGFSIPVARASVLTLAMLTIVGVYRLARLLSQGWVPITVTVLTAAYSVFFTHCTMVVPDLAAAGFTIWGLEAYLRGRRWRAALILSLAVFTKETAIVTPLVLATLECITAIRAHKHSDGRAVRQVWRSTYPLLVPFVVLVCWFCWLYHATGTLFGDADYVQFNLYEPLRPMRVLLAAFRQLFHLFGYLNLFVLTIPAAVLWATRAALPACRTTPQDRRSWLTLGAVTAGYVAMFSVLGGTQLPRYLLAVDPIVILGAVALIAARVRWWPAIAAVAAAAFVVGLLTYPSFYGLVVEDNFAYLDYVALHQDAARFVAGIPGAAVLTKYPASKELTQPWLGYTGWTVAVTDMGDFTQADFLAEPRIAHTQTLPAYLLLFPTSYAPPHPFPRPRWWHHGLAVFGNTELAPDEVARLIHARTVYFAERRGEWIAVLELEATDGGVKPRPAH